MQYRYTFAQNFFCRIASQQARNLVGGRLVFLIALFSLFALASEIPSNLSAQASSPLPRIKSPIADSLENLLTTNLSDSVRKKGLGFSRDFQSVGRVLLLLGYFAR